jgi:hypothetical protein
MLITVMPEFPCPQGIFPRIEPIDVRADCVEHIENKRFNESVWNRETLVAQALPRVKCHFVEIFEPAGDGK